MKSSSSNANADALNRAPSAAIPPGASAAQGHAEPEFQPPERPTTMDEQGRRRWVYPAAAPGPFMTFRTLVAWVLIAIMVALPWLRVGGMPAVLLEIPTRRFVLFGHIFWPQDGIYLVFLLLGLALALFFFTALAGRVWCGWACPQTVFMEAAFRRIEEWIEGDHHQRLRRDAAPLTLGKAARKTLKHGVFLLLAALVSNTFLAYFVGTDVLVHWMTGPPADHWTAFLIMAGTLGLFYFDFAWFREQFCVVLCPYARFQAVLTDAHTLQVGYDTPRGEPRGRLGTVSGDCVDCHRCVAVCPTGIDIRQGYQLECIGCARCIDACDEIMVRVGKPRGLIRYDSLSRLQGEVTRILRPRVIVYSLLLAGVVAALVVALEVDSLVDVTIVRPPGEPYAVLPGGIVSNHFTLHLINRSRIPHQFRLAVAGLPQAVLITALNPLPVGAGEQVRAEAFVNVPAGAVKGGKAPLSVQVYDGPTVVGEQGGMFLAPAAP